jgi:hypothetical protein
VKRLEYVVGNRGSWRRGDVERIPLTLSHIQWWLRKPEPGGEGEITPEMC